MIFGEHLSELLQELVEEGIGEPMHALHLNQFTGYTVQPAPGILFFALPGQSVIRPRREIQ
jgi:hypothetical protein